MSMNDKTEQIDTEKVDQWIANFKKLLEEKQPTERPTDANGRHIDWCD